MSKISPVPFATTLHVREHCLCLAAQSAARALARLFDDALRPVGLTSGQFSLLMSLNQPEAPSVGAVAGLLAMDRTTLTANLKPLKRSGLVKISVDPTDRRSRRLGLTRAGRSVLKAAVPIWRRTQARAEKQVSVAIDADTLRAGLRTLS
ncbi:MAG: MarR family winged helix-turn-helix transcriptional regulator [Pseudomonadota bacterium]